CHDSGVHRKMAPEGQAARAVFDAVEQARVEAIGSKRMAGVASNLGAMLEDRYHRGNYHEITDRADAPLEDAVAMIARERMTGLKPPPAAQRIVDLWRPWVEEKAGSELDRLGETLENQRAFARSVRDLLVSLDMAEESKADSDDQEDDDKDGETEPDQQEQEGEYEDQNSSERAEAESTDESSDDMEEGQSETSDGPTSDMPDDYE
ncbi:hypothetical protein WDZ92_53605, partial [Nostoc sp. NIES-2111]